MPERAQDAATVSSVDRALHILEWLSEIEGTAQSIRAIADATSIGKSTVHRLLETLAHRGWVVQAEEGTYKLGTKALHISAAVLRQLDVLGTIRPFAMRLRSETAQTAFICVLDDNALLIVDILESPSQLRFTRPIGSRSLLHGSAAGKALLATMSLDALEDYLATPLESRTPATITDPQTLRQELVKVRSDGYAIADNEGYIGIKSFGAAVHDYTGSPVAAISISGPRDEMIRDECNLVTELLRATQSASRQLGCPASSEVRV